MKYITCITFASLLAVASSLNAQVTLIAGWNFNTSPGTNLADYVNDQENMPQSYIANFGSGTLYADGTNGASLWLREGELNNPTNLGSRHLRILSSDFVGRSLAFVQPENAANDGNDAIGKNIVFAFSMETYAGVDVTYNSRRSSNQTFAELVWEYSTDADTWAPLQTLTYDGTQLDWTLEDRLNTITGLSDASTAFLRVTFGNATGNPGGDRNFQFDNIQFNATPIPEPAHMGALLGLIALSGLLWARRRK